MLKFKLIISDEAGALHTVEHESQHNANLADFNAIEDACASFIASAIPQVEVFLLEKAQDIQVTPVGFKKTVVVP